MAQTSGAKGGRLSSQIVKQNLDGRGVDRLGYGLVGVGVGAAGVCVARAWAWAWGGSAACLSAWEGRTRWQMRSERKRTMRPWSGATATGGSSQGTYEAVAPARPVQLLKTPPAPAACPLPPAPHCPCGLPQVACRLALLAVLGKMEEE